MTVKIAIITRNGYVSVMMSTMRVDNLNIRTLTRLCMCNVCNVHCARTSSMFAMHFASAFNPAITAISAIDG